MIDILRDPLWQFLSIMLASTAVAISLIQWPRRNLVWEVFYARPLSNAPDSSDFSIHYQNHNYPSTEVTELAIDIRNVGNQPIEAEHFQRPLSIHFGDNCEILNLEVAEERPEGIGASVINKSQSVTLKPLLLNKRDLVCIKALVWQRDQICLDGRITDVRQIKQGSLYKRLALSSLLDFVGIALLGPGFFLYDYVPNDLRGMANAALVMAFLIFIVSSFIGWREIIRARRRGG